MFSSHFQGGWDSCKLARDSARHISINVVSEAHNVCSVDDNIMALSRHLEPWLQSFRARIAIILANAKICESECEKQNTKTKQKKS